MNFTSKKYSILSILQIERNSNWSINWIPVKPLDGQSGLTFDIKFKLDGKNFFLLELSRHTFEMCVVVLHIGHGFGGIVNDDQVKTSIK